MARLHKRVALIEDKLKTLEDQHDVVSRVLSSNAAASDESITDAMFRYRELRNDSIYPQIRELIYLLEEFKLSERAINTVVNVVWGLAGREGHKLHREIQSHR